MTLNTPLLHAGTHQELLPGVQLKLTHRTPSQSARFSIMNWLPCKLLHWRQILCAIYYCFRRQECFFRALSHETNYLLPSMITRVLLHPQLCSTERIWGDNAFSLSFLWNCNFYNSENNRQWFARHVNPYSAGNQTKTAYDIKCWSCAMLFHKDVLMLNLMPATCLPLYCITAVLFYFILSTLCKHLGTEKPGCSFGNEMLSHFCPDWGFQRLNSSRSSLSCFYYMMGQMFSGGDESGQHYRAILFKYIHNLVWHCISLHIVQYYWWPSRCAGHLWHAHSLTHRLGAEMDVVVFQDHLSILC